MHRKLTHEATQDTITITTVVDGGKNAVLLVTGTVSHEDDSSFDLVDLTKLQGFPKSIRLDSVSHVVESGLKCLLKYREHPYILPFEGRGKFDLGVAGGVQGHEIDLVLKGTGSFFLVLDISKMGV
jgi:hypothetical protein